MLGFFKLLQHGGKCLISQRIVGHLGIFIHRIAARALQIVFQLQQAGIALFQLFAHLFLGVQAFARHIHQALHAAFDHTVAQIASDIGIQRQQHHDAQPGQLQGGLIVGIDDVQAHHGGGCAVEQVEQQREVYAQQAGQLHQKNHLRQHQQCDNARAAKNNAQQALFFRLEQPKLFSVECHKSTVPFYLEYMKPQGVLAPGLKNQF